MIRILFLLLLSYTVLGQHKINIKKLDSIIDLRQINLYSIALNDIEKALKKETNFKKKQVLIAKKAAILIDSNRLFEAQSCINWGQSICKSDNCYPEKAKLNCEQANLFLKKNQLSKALEVILHNNLILERLNLKSDDLIYSYSKTGYYFNLFEDYANAELYLKKSLNLDKKLNKAKSFAALYNNLGILSKKQQKWEEAIQYYKLTLAEDRKHFNTSDNLYTYNNIASVYLDVPNLDSVYYYLNLAKRKATKEELSNSSVYVNYCLYFNRINQLDSVKHYANLFLKKNVHKEENSKRLAILYEELSKVYENHNQLDSAFFYHKKLFKLKENQWYNTERKELLQTAEQKANFKYQQQVIKALEQKTFYQEENINQKKITLLIFGIAFFLALLLGYLFYNRMLIKNQKNQLQLEQQVLRSQMNPHFIFNVLTSIQHTVINNDPLNAATAISRFSKLIRQNFDLTQKELITIDEDLDALKNYMNTQLIRFTNKFLHEINLDLKQNSDELLIPPMLLQPLIENAIEHGFKNINYQGKITINISENQDNLTIKIIDNGVGFKPSDDKSTHALDIIQKRLKMHNGKTKTLFAIHYLNPGTAIQFNLKKRIK